MLRARFAVHRPEEAAGEQAGHRGTDGGVLQGREGEGSYSREGGAHGTGAAREEQGAPADPGDRVPGGEEEAAVGRRRERGVRD